MMKILTCLALSISVLFPVQAQQSTPSDSLPVATQWLVNAASPTQRNSITSVFLMVCPATQRKGTSFLTSEGLVVSNEHVVRGCDTSNLYAITPKGETLRFSKIVVDVDRDLAVLRSTATLKGGLELGTDMDPKLEAAVSTWGFPLIYNGPAPILSVGYVAGFNAVKVGNKTVRHIVVNGAFNPGNSGGPVFLPDKAGKDPKVVGVVVWKQTLLTNTVPLVINGLRHSGFKIGSNLVQTMPDGSRRGPTEQEAVAAALEEFYNMVQVMIGEAISVSELRAFLAERKGDLGEKVSPH